VSVGANGPDPSVEVSLEPSQHFESARALAASFGGPVFEPTWWPEDVRRPLSYERGSSPVGYTYGIVSTREDGVPIAVIGGADRPEKHLPTGHWSALPELKALRGQVLKDDGRIHAVVYDEQQIIHLIGYASEAEVVRAVGSFRRVTAH
jgi:hypothetical protein